MVEAFDADLVLIVVFVGNDAVEAHDKASWIDAGGPPVASVSDVAATRLRRLVRSSMVLQSARLRWDLLRSRVAGPTAERPLTSYLKDAPPDVLNGLEVSRRAFGLIADQAASKRARTAFVLMPARFQTDDADFERLRAVVAAGGGTLVRDAATDRFRAALAPLGLPMIDVLPTLRAEPDRGELFFQRNVHLTPRGHRVVGKALTAFVKSLLNEPH